MQHTAYTKLCYCVLHHKLLNCPTVLIYRDKQSWQQLSKAIILGQVWSQWKKLAKETILSSACNEKVH